MYLLKPNSYLHPSFAIRVIDVTAWPNFSMTLKASQYRLNCRSLYSDVVGTLSFHDMNCVIQFSWFFLSPSNFGKDTLFDNFLVLTEFAHGLAPHIICNRIAWPPSTEPRRYAARLSLATLHVTSCCWLISWLLLLLGSSYCASAWFCSPLLALSLSLRFHDFSH